MRPSIVRNVSLYQNTFHKRPQNFTGALQFKKMAVDSAPEIRRYMDANRWRTCDYTVGGMLMWADYFDYYYCIINDTLFVKGVSENHPDMVAFSVPLGAMDLKGSVAMLLDYCTKTDCTPAFTAVPMPLAVELSELIGGRIEALYDWSDYLFDAQSLASLEGKAYSKKRNHVNRFMSDNSNSKFELLNAENIASARNFLLGVDVGSKDDYEKASYELNQCDEVLKHNDLYCFDGGVLYDNTGSVCAITMGEVVGDTLYVHIEKMNHAVAGCGETINKLFAKSMLERYPQLLYINREEDMGDYGLRHAKESYHPVALLEKCNVVCD